MDMQFIDVSNQWKIDPSGVVISSLSDNQWRFTTFSPMEQSLFSNLDTTNLIGTSTPDSTIEVLGSGNFPHPNPFLSVHYLSFQFNNNYSGEYVLKYVIVNTLLKPVFSLAIRLGNNNNGVAIIPDIPIGKYRLFYTLSSLQDPHFYKSWGNIEKLPR